MKKIIPVIIAKTFLIVCFLFSAQQAAAQVTGTKTIPGDYATIGAAIADIQSSGLSGHVVLELQQSYYWHNELFPITIPENFPTGPNATVTLRPEANATQVFVGTGVLGGGPIGTGHKPVFKVYGSYFNFDGRPGGVGTSREMIFWVHDFEGSAIEFANNAHNNLVTYCDFWGMNDPTQPGGSGLKQGIITFNPEGPFPVGVLGGINNNTIENCLFEGVIPYPGAEYLKPYYMIYAYGNPNAPSVGNKIQNNEFRNFGKSCIEITIDGPGAGWTITGNSFYSTLSDYTYPEFAINIQHGNGNKNGTNIIDGNYIGGSGPQAAGKWLGGPMFGIVCNSFYGGVSASIQNNVIKNMEKINPVPYPSFNNNDVFAAISVKNSNGTNVMQCSGNQIGGDAGDFGISISAPAAGGDASFYGILYTNCSSGAITQNVIQNIRMSSAESSMFIGIKANTIDNVDISQNTIQQLDIQSAGDVSIYALIDEYDHHELSPCEPVTAQPPVIDGNLIKTITASADDGSASFTGITISARLGGNTGNIVGSATAANNINISGKTASVKGIVVSGTPEDVSISNDIIANLTANGTESASVNGIYFNGAGTVKFSGNQVHHLTAPVAKGIFIEPAAGTSATTIEKNTVTGVNTSFGTGIEANVPSTATLTFTAKENTVSNWQNGFLISAAAGSTLTQTVQGNFLTGNQTGFNNQTSGMLNATCNWWGSASGPSGAGPGTGDPVGSNVIFSPWATIAAFVAVNAGADQTIYLGYGPTGKTLTPVYTVCGTPSYLWSTGATTSSITVSPATTTTYSITVTDANGHSATDYVTVTVKDIRCGTNKVKVCHKDTRTNKKQTLCISTNDVASHLAHGDVLGDCTGAGARQMETPVAEITKGFEVNIYPNPGKSYFTVQINSADAGPVEIRIINGLGQVIKNIREPGNTIRFGHDLKTGIYIAEVRQGSNMKTIKLIKYE